MTAFNSNFYKKLLNDGSIGHKTDNENNKTRIIFLMILIAICLYSYIIDTNNTYYKDTDTEEINFKFNSNVYVYPTSGIKYKMISDAILEWEEKTNNLIKFNIVKNIENADITIKYVDKFSDSQHTGAIGLTKRYIYSMEQNNKKGNYFNDYSDGQISSDIELLNGKANKKTIIHELGHAIGILEHSGNLKNIMYPKDNIFNFGLTDNDIMMAKMLPITNDKNNDFYKFYTIKNFRNYYIDSCNSDKYNDSECKISKESFSDWQKIKGINENNIKKQVKNFEDSDVFVFFVDTINNGKQLANITYFINRGVLYINIKIARRGILPNDKTKTIVTLTNSQKKSLLLHEIGHACGIFDSKNVDSIMYPYANLKNKLSKYNNGV